MSTSIFCHFSVKEGGKKLKGAPREQNYYGITITALGLSWVTLSRRPRKWKQLLALFAQLMGNLLSVLFFLDPAFDEYFMLSHVVPSGPD